MDLVFSLAQRLGAPPFLSKPIMALLAEKPLLPPVVFPDPSFTRARKDKHGRQMPQAVAHRGFKAKYPENTMCAFKGAIDAGVHALETDVHLSRDGVVVLSHDASLLRCFGEDQKIIDCDWDQLSRVRTIAEPHEPLARLDELLQYLAQPGLESKWVLLDIKLDNNAHDIMRLIAKAIRSVKPLPGTRWENRILLGCWAAKFIPLSHEYLPGYSITNIGFSISYCRQFLSVANVSFNMLQATLVSPGGRKLIRDIKARDREIYSWTVNDEKNMDWCIRRQLDAVITDNPQKFLEVCERYQEDVEPKWEAAMVMNFVRINIFAFIFGLLFWLKYGFGLEARYLMDKTK